MPIEQKFLEDIEANPHDPAPKLAFADWLRDDGRVRYAYTYEWAARNGKHPYSSPEKKNWYWKREGKRPARGRVSEPHYVPWLVWESMINPGQWRMSMAEAFGKLGHALFLVRMAASWQGGEVENPK
jgi:uncharacterized protein (TIGR02996 family)